MIKTQKARIPIGGFLKQSLLDYPGFLSCIVYTQGCNMRCRYCHNPNLVYPALIKQSEKLNTVEIIDWISKNSRLLDAVVITGGEPTLHRSLPSFIRQFKEMGLKVKLDTNGSNPEMLEKLIEGQYVDHIAMDVKAPLETSNYHGIMASRFNSSLLPKIMQSVRLLNRQQVSHEYRVTLDNSLTLVQLEQILAQTRGNLYLQPVRDINTQVELPHPGITAADLQWLCGRFPGREVSVR